MHMGDAVIYSLGGMIMACIMLLFGRHTHVSLEFLTCYSKSEHMQKSWHECHMKFCSILINFIWELMNMLYE